ncbi:MAG TPA: hypothetical protein VGP70_00540 [Actinomadura sp.]|jgi:peptide deformylase|nr:hypothetical protein [Actinomadura sp.]
MRSTWSEPIRPRTCAYDVRHRADARGVEGCLSFFDVRDLVPRPLSLEIEHTRLDGRQVITILEEYRGTGHAWIYH